MRFGGRIRAWLRRLGGAVLVAGTAWAQTKVVGTDLLGTDVSRVLYEFSGRAGFPLALALDGSLPALGRLESGRAQVGLIFRRPEEIGTVEDCEAMTLAYQVVYVLAPAGIPLQEVALGQLRDVFGDNGSHNLDRWGGLGLGGGLASSAITPLVPDAGQGIAAGYFRRAVLNDQPFKSTAGRYATPADLERLLSGNSHSLAIASVRPVGAPPVRIVRIATRAGEPAYSPTPENLRSGDYPLALPLQVVFRRGSARELRPLLRFLFSDEFAPVLEKAGVVPLPPSARQEPLRMIEKG